MKEYYLFLDESKPNSNFDNFTLGGICILKEDYENQIKDKVKECKNIFFGDHNVVLHEIDIRKKNGVFNTLDRDDQKRLMSEVGKILDSNLTTVFAVSINIGELDMLYDKSSRNDIYYISLQLLMENFMQMLIKNNGSGTIFLESTDSANDAKLQNLFHMLKATGTLFITKETMQKRLHTINFAMKSDNNIGLQLADFIPNPLGRKALGKKQKPMSLYDVIERRLYDGGVEKRERFGFKIVD